MREIQVGVELRFHGFSWYRLSVLLHGLVLLYGILHLTLSILNIIVVTRQKRRVRMYRLSETQLNIM